MILAAAMLWPLASQATPYASCITNNAGTIQFYLNESGGNVTVTYEDGTTNASFDGITTGLNLASGTQSFALGSHTSYTISVFKVGTGSAAVIHTLSYGTPRGIDVNKNPSSPYFGNVYASCASAAAPTNALRQLNSDLSGISTNSGGVAWLTSSSEPYRLLVCDDDYLAFRRLAHFPGSYHQPESTRPPRRHRRKCGKFAWGTNWRLPVAWQYAKRGRMHFIHG
jgi:hypothetical protein